ncbi:MAG: DUF3078 domain-containing protein [Bacteroidia bacterium]|nr:DUF3078 domain-containing protein [Bacteroidia bacterium]MDW8058382.1 DUF3078 domain-containing protein [Bacteroidia bacterium]
MRTCLYSFQEEGTTITRLMPLGGHPLMNHKEGRTVFPSSTAFWRKGALRRFSTAADALQSFLPLMRGVVICIITTAFAQEDTAKAWKVEGFLGLQAAQTALTNWQAGGQNQISAGTQQRLFIARDYFRHSWNLEYTGQYGLLRVVPQKTWRKTQDFLLVVSQYKYALSPRWALSVLADGRTQWTPTYDYVGDSMVRPAKSAFLAPLYGQFSLGLRYRVLEGWQVILSLLSERVTYVRLGYLADAGAFGLKPAERDPNGTIIRPARRTLWEIGGRLTSRLNITPVSGLSVSHFLDVFYSYSAPSQSPIVLSQLQAAYKLKSWLALTLSQQAIYDRRVGRGQQALQLLTSWSVGVTWQAKYPRSK